jgi:hypothetical protein
MTKKKIKTKIKYYDKIDDEILFEDVNEVFSDHPEDYISKLEDLGFEWFDDDSDKNIEFIRESMTRYL